MSSIIPRHPRKYDDRFRRLGSKSSVEESDEVTANMPLGEIPKDGRGQRVDLLLFGLLSNGDGRDIARECRSAASLGLRTVV